MKIQTTNWNKTHIMEGIKYACESELVKQARQLDAYEWGVYRGESTQLIDNTFYGYQFPIRKIHAIDSFEGLPKEADNVECFYLFREGVFADVGSRLYPLRSNGQYIKSWFSDLTKEDIQKYDFKPAAFVHIDGDMYISCIQALTYMLDNYLVIPGTVIAFDEFKSTSTLDAGGESKAWFELCDKYLIEAEEFFRNIYNDSGNGMECWQNAFLVKGIGQKSSHGVYGV